MIVKYYRFVLERNVLEVLTIHTKEPEIECRTDVWGTWHCPGGIQAMSGH
jgi:hypothetical protein